MTKAHYRKRPGKASNGGRVLRGREIEEHNVKKQQGVTRDGKRLIPQCTLDRWTAETQRVEAKMARMRAITHDFVRLGTLPGCELCGEPSNAVSEIGRRIHFDPRLRGPAVLPPKRKNGKPDRRRKLDPNPQELWPVKFTRVSGGWETHDGRWRVEAVSTNSRYPTEFWQRPHEVYRIYRVCDMHRLVTFWKNHTCDFLQLHEAREEIAHIERAERLAKF